MQSVPTAITCADGLWTSYDNRCLWDNIQTPCHKSYCCSLCLSWLLSSESSMCSSIVEVWGIIIPPLQQSQYTTAIPPVTKPVYHRYTTAIPPVYKASIPPLQQNQYTGFTWSVHLSVCPSVRPSICPSICGRNCVCSVSSTMLAGSISYLHILSSNFRRCVACSL